MSNIPLPISAESSDSHAQKKPAAASSPAKATPEPELENPYDYEQNTHTDTFKALRCMAFLLEWGSDVGNHNLDGHLANGVAQALCEIAETVQRYLFDFDDVLECGGDPLSLPRNKRPPKQS